MKPFLTASVLAFALSLPAQAQVQAQQSQEPKLKITGISLNPEGDTEFYNGTVYLSLFPVVPGHAQPGLQIIFSHVKSIEEIKEKIKPDVEHIADELKKAADDFEKHH